MWFLSQFARGPGCAVHGALAAKRLGPPRSSWGWRDQAAPAHPGGGGTGRAGAPARSIDPVSGSNVLGEYLRARRELVDPADVGLTVAGVRRTPGLRREEVATLAGVSADYYLRLEQGRDRNPSRQVLEALARVPGLDASATESLIGLSAGRTGGSRRPRREVVPTGIRQLLDSLG